MNSLSRLILIGLLPGTAFAASLPHTLTLVDEGAHAGGAVLGPSGVIYWLENTTPESVTVLNSSNGEIARETRPVFGTTPASAPGNFPVGVPLDANATTVLNMGVHFLPGPNGIGDFPKPGLFLNGATLLASRESTIPGITTNELFQTKGGSFDSDGSVVFVIGDYGNNVIALCRSIGGSIQVLAKTGETEVPGAPGSTFTDIAYPTSRNGVTHFYGESGLLQGIYQISGGLLTVVADNGANNLPGAMFWPHEPQEITFANDGLDSVICFYGDGVWKRIGGTWSVVANDSTLVPGSTEMFTVYGSPAVRGGRVAFVGAGSTVAGIYFSNSGTGLETAIENSDSEIPGSPASGGGRWWDGDSRMLLSGSTGIHLVTLGNPVLAANPDVLNIRGTGATKLDVLGNDTGPVGTTLEVTAVTQGATGKVTLSGGKVSYKPDADFTGTDTFTYTLTGGAETEIGTVTVTNPFLTLRGTFGTLVTGTGGAAVGTLNATLTVGGTISGKLIVAGKSYTLKGSVDFDGIFMQIFKRKPTGTPEFVLTLNFAATVDFPTIAGSVSGDPTPYTIPAASVAITTLPPGVKDGPYTLLLPPDGTAANPRGIGWAKATLTKLGKLTIAGRLGDDTTFSAGTALNAADLAAIYVPLYTKPKGEIAGTLAFDGSGARTLLTGTLAWRKPAQDKQTGLFLPGFAATTAVSGAAYLPPLTDARALNYPDPINKADVHVAGAALANVDEAVSVSAADKVTADVPGPHDVKAKITRKTGLLSGSFVPVADAKAIKFTGVLQQAENRGAGVFSGAAQTGTVTFVPR